MGSSGTSLFVPATSPSMWLPLPCARSPWSPHSLHGGPVAALMARAMEGCEPAGAAGMHVARFTLELLHPVPLEPLALRVAVTRPGWKVQVVEAWLSGPDGDVAWARALRIRTRVDVPGIGDGPDGRKRPFPGPAESVLTPPISDDYPGFHNVGAELRFAAGRFDTPGPAVAWVRLKVPVVPDEVPTPLQRVVAAADFGNGVSAVLPWARYRFVNPDLTVFSARSAAGEWVALQSQTSLGTPGVGQASSVLWDENGPGPVGSSWQNLVVEPR